MTVLDKHLPKAIDEWGARNSHKFVIGCKATSMKEANEMALKLGLDKNTFPSANVIVANIIDISMIDKHGFIRPIHYLENESIDIRTVL